MRPDALRIVNSCSRVRREQMVGVMVRLRTQSLASRTDVFLFPPRLVPFTCSFDFSHPRSHAVTLVVPTTQKHITEYRPGI